MNTRRHCRTLSMTYIALSAVLITLCSWVSIPSAVPFTLQTFAVFCVLSLLGGKRGVVAMLLYLALGAVGIPVFSGFGAGVGVLLGPTGGYIIGFVVCALVYWGVCVLSKGRLWGRIAGLLLGLCCCYTFGTAWFMQVYSAANGAISLATALGWCVLPFILPDLLKLALALLLTRRLARALLGLDDEASVQKKEKGI